MRVKVTSSTLCTERRAVTALLLVASVAVSDGQTIPKINCVEATSRPPALASNQRVSGVYTRYPSVMASKLSGRVVERWDSATRTLNPKRFLIPNGPIPHAIQGACVRNPCRGRWLGVSRVGAFRQDARIGGGANRGEVGLRPNQRGRLLQYSGGKKG